MAILSLTFFQPYIKNWWTPKTYISNFIWDLVSVALAAQVLVVPITIYFFHKFPVYFILTGVISVFLSNIALYLGLIIFLVEYLFSPINIILGYLFSIIMKLFIYSVQLVKEIPYCSIDGLILNDFEMIIIYVFLIMLMLYLVNKKFYLIKSMALIIVLFIISTGLRIHNANHQVGFTIYDDRKSNIIDIFDGRTVYGIRLDSLKENSNPFINLNNRYKNSINEFKEVGFDDFIGINSRKLNNVIQLKEKNLLIINNELDLFDLSDIDFLFLTNNLRFDSSIKLKPSIKIIVDRSFDQENLKSWEDNLSANKIYFHSIKNDGSFTVRI
jgi:competence protein ComEC